MTDFIVARGTIYYILVWTVTWFLIDYAQKWFFERFAVHEKALRTGVFIIIFLALITFTLICPRAEGRLPPDFSKR